MVGKLMDFCETGACFFVLIMERLQWIFLLQAEVEIWAWSCIISLIIPLQCISRQSARSPGTKGLWKKATQI